MTPFLSAVSRRRDSRINKTRFCSNAGHTAPLAPHWYYYDSVRDIAVHTLRCRDKMTEDGNGISFCRPFDLFLKCAGLYVEWMTRLPWQSKVEQTSVAAIDSPDKSREVFQ